jgi:hypothetical protein
LTEKLVGICLEKHNADSLFQEGCSSELVTIIKHLPPGYEEFNEVMLNYITECFEDLSISWATMVLQDVAQKHDS